MLPKPPRLLVEGELVVPDVLPLDDGERPTTVGVDGLLGPVVVVGDRGDVVVVVLRPPPPHNQTPLDPVPVVEPDRVLLPEPHRSGCHSLVWGFCRHVVPACRTWQASIVG